MKKLKLLAGICALTMGLSACSILPTNINLDTNITVGEDPKLKADDLKEVKLDDIDLLNDNKKDAENNVETNNENVNGTNDTNDDVEKIIAQIKNSPEFEDFAKLYDNVSPVSNTMEYEGEWSRTNIHNGYSAIVSISNVTLEGFDFEAEANYFSHMGIMTQTAEFVTESCAICKYVDTSVQYIVFIFENDMINIYATGSSADLGFGMNVSIDGTYTFGEPQYTNANILHETFTDEQLAAIKAKSTEEAYDNFVFIVENGLIDDSEIDGSRYVTGWIPTLGEYSFEVIIENGAVTSVSVEFM